MPHFMISSRVRIMRGIIKIGASISANMIIWLIGLNSPERRKPLSKYISGSKYIWQILKKNAYAMNIVSHRFLFEILCE